MITELTEFDEEIFELNETKEDKRKAEICEQIEKNIKNQNLLIY